MDPAVERRSGVNLERHVQTVLIALCTGGIMFAANYFFADRGDKAVLVTQMQHMSTTMTELKAEIKALNALYVTKTVDMEARIRVLERDSQKRSNP